MMAADIRHAVTQTVPEWRGIDRQCFEQEIVPTGRPAILRGAVADWPLVRLAQSPRAVCDYLLRHGNAQPIDALLLHPDEDGLIGFNADMSGFNYLRNRLPLGQIIEQLTRYAGFPRHPALAAQSALIHECAPGMLAEHPQPLLPSTVQPRIWLGNEIVTPAHFDESSNLACSVAGRRRFTVFPPNQIGNLYLGPLDFAPTLTPISMANLLAPDFERFPRLRAALSVAQVADLAPGDALYLPPLWLHHVVSLDPLNVLINYWWRTNQVGQQAQSGLGSLWHAVMALRQLPQPDRDAWSVLFAHYVFGDPAAAQAHLPESRHGMLGAMDAEQIAALRKRLASLLDAA
jgi:hypothetical protein